MNLGLGYLLNGEFFPIPNGAELVIEAPTAPIVNSPLDNGNQLKRDARVPSAPWRNLGLGKRSVANQQRYRARAMMGLGK